MPAESQFSPHSDRYYVGWSSRRFDQTIPNNDIVCLRVRMLLLPIRRQNSHYKTSENTVSLFAYSSGLHALDPYDEPGGAIGRSPIKGSVLGSLLSATHPMRGPKPVSYKKL